MGAFVTVLRSSTHEICSHLVHLNSGVAIRSYVLWITNIGSYSWNALIYFTNNKVRYHDQNLPRKWSFSQVLIFRLNSLHCCVDQGHEKLAFLAWSVDILPGARGETGFLRTGLILAHQKQCNHPNFVTFRRVRQFALECIGIYSLQHCMNILGDFESFSNIVTDWVFVL